jgi:RNA polymerase sigma-70 factor (ECF subfamily)
MTARSNADWVRALSEAEGETLSQALQDLRDFLVRATLVYLSQHRSELALWSQADILQLAEDCAQETLLEIRSQLSTFRGEAKFTTWAYRFVINRAASELRRQRYRNVSLDWLRDDVPSLLQKMVTQGTRTEPVEPEHLVEQRAYLQLLTNIISNELTDRQRLAVIGVHWQGRSMEEVAAVLGLTRNALYKLLHDARKRIKAKLAEHYLTEGDILAAFEE